MKPLAIDLFCGLGGWTEGLLAEGWRVVGFDIEQHAYGDERYPAQLVLQDVLTIHGSQFKDADLIVASPPCQEFSYMAMPWSKAKIIAKEYRDGTRDVKKLTALFDACFRIQREACESAGRLIPLVVENVRGAIPWVGRSRWNYGSFHLWGDVPALMPMSKAIKNNGGPWFNIGSPGQKVTGQNPDGRKVEGFRFDGSGKSFQSASVDSLGIKAPGMNWSDPDARKPSPNRRSFTDLAGRQFEGNKGVPHRTKIHWTTPAEHESADATKIGGDWFSDPNSTCRKHGSKSSARKRASAMIAKIPLPLSRHIARTYYFTDRLKTNEPA